MSETEAVCDECGASILDADKSNENWKVYHCTCPTCGARTEEVTKRILLEQFEKSRGRKRRGR